MKIERQRLLQIAVDAARLAAEVQRNIDAHEEGKFGPDKHTYNALEMVQALDEWRELRKPLWDYLDTLDDATLSTFWGMVRLGRESVRRGGDANLGDIDRDWLSAEEMGTTDREGTIQAILATPSLEACIERGRALALTV